MMPHDKGLNSQLTGYFPIRLAAYPICIYEECERLHQVRGSCNKPMCDGDAVLTWFIFALYTGVQDRPHSQE